MKCKQRGLVVLVCIAVGGCSSTVHVYRESRCQAAQDALLAEIQTLSQQRARAQDAETVAGLDEAVSGRLAELAATRCVDGGLTERVPGIPFYIKRPTFSQVTRLEQTWLEVVLVVKKLAVASQKVVSEEAHAKRIAKDQLGLLLGLKQKLTGAGPFESRAEFQDHLAWFRDKLRDVTDPAGPPARVIGNEIRTEWDVDGSVTYFLNAPLPWFGAGNLTQKINDNGTLQEASSAPDTKLAEGLSKLVPLKEFLTSKLVPDQADGATLAKKKNGKPASHVYQLALKIDEVGYIYECRKQLTAAQADLFAREPQMLQAVECDVREGKGVYTRLRVGEAGAAPGQKIGVAGQIVVTGELGKPK